VAPAAVCERETSPIQAAQWIQDSAGGWMLERDRGRERPGPRERDGDGGSMSANRPVRLEARETGAERDPDRDYGEIYQKIALL